MNDAVFCEPYKMHAKNDKNVCFLKTQQIINFEQYAIAIILITDIDLAWN